MANQAQNQGQGHSDPSHNKKDGTPDHRFKENRGNGENENIAIASPNSSQSNQASKEENSQHFTGDGKPDMRYAENRKLPEEEVNRQWAENIAANAPENKNISQDHSQQTPTKR